MISNLTLTGESVAAFEPVIHRMIQDSQERLIFRTSVFMNDKLRSFQPKPDDLDYPAKLIKARSEKTGDVTKDLYKSCYPTLEITLRLLNRLYNALEIGVFEDIAQVAVSLCANSFLESSKLISKKQVHFLLSCFINLFLKGVIDGQLFLIKHLLTLREQISSFDVNFTTMEISLDFSHLRSNI